MCSDLLSLYKADGESSKSRIITGDETRIQHLEPKTKKESVEWHHAICSQKMKCKPARVMAILLWDREMLVDIIRRGQTINTHVCFRILKTFRKRCGRWRCHKHVAEIILHRDNSRARTSLKTQEDIKKLRWTPLLPNPSYSPDLAHCVFHLFGALHGK